MQVNYQVESDTKPRKFEIENILNGNCDIIINDDVVEKEETIIDEKGKETTRKKFIYNSYRITTNFRDDLNAELISEKGYQKWVSEVKQKYYDEKANEVRAERNRLLQESDQYMCFDRFGIEIPENITATNLLTVVKSFFKGLGTSINGNYAKYRQELRDITKQEGFPFNVEFPMKPEINNESEDK